MCLSSVGLFVFGILMVITLAMTAISMFLPGLQQLKKAVENTDEDLKHFRIPKEFDLFDSFCRFAITNNITVNASINSIDFCKYWFHELEDWEKIVAIFMCLSAIAEVITICWTIITCLSCSCRKICLQLLPILSLIVVLFLTAAITIFTMNNQRIIDKITNVTKSFEIKILDGLDSRFYWACVALAMAIIDFFVACLNICFVKFCC